MRIFFSVVIVLLSFGFKVSAQQIMAQLLDKADKQPIAYANIGILGSDMGTNSDDNGNFSINIGKEQEDQIISISLVGYQTYKVKVTEFENQLKSNSNKLYLQK